MLKHDNKMISMLFIFLIKIYHRIRYHLIFTFILTYLLNRSQRFYDFFIKIHTMAIKYYFANWKMFQSFSAIKKFLKDFKKDESLQAQFAGKNIGIAASYEHLYFLQ